MNIEISRACTADVHNVYVSERQKLHINDNIQLCCIYKIHVDDGQNIFFVSVKRLLERQGWLDDGWGDGRHCR